MKFKMKVVRGHKTPLSRQIHESIEIENSKADFLMNSKGEYNGSRIPRIVIEVGDKVETEDWPGQEKEQGTRRKMSNNYSGAWMTNNRKKRKLENEEGITECGQAEPKPVENQAQNKRRKTECGTAESRSGEGNGVTKHGKAQPECGTAQPPVRDYINMMEKEDDDELYQAGENVETCGSIVEEYLEKTWAEVSKREVGQESNPTLPELMDENARNKLSNAWLGKRTAPKQTEGWAEKVKM